MTSEPKKKSRYAEAGSPTRCYLPSCKKPFESTCYRGDDDQFYCSESCAHEGFDAESTIVRIRKRG